MEAPKVCILLAAYNGREYIRQMIDSVLAQDYGNIRLILSDDGSQDGTGQILEEYAQNEPERVILYRSGTRFGCAQYHFLHLLSRFQDEQYIMFCDQDDVWHRDKVRKTLAKMQELEAGTDIPAMVHTDLRVVDADLRLISPSFWHYSSLDGKRLALNQLLVQNTVTGCTVMINRSLARCVCSAIPEEGILMHDWWIALLASVCGRADALNEATMDYRQHGNNGVGAKEVRSVRYLWQRLTGEGMQRRMSGNKVQAQLLLKHHAGNLNADQKTLISAFIKAQESPWPVRNFLYVRYGLLKYGFIRIAAQLLGF